ncbi:universal stress protein [Halopenitus salinus]|jgi:nucleotide-binding universal stress UspA family protein|uniref:Universal stress protein n=1 Tax=Halopenitus salinus TaxID=1198295 RepID=A0ABD5UUJ7_9EURY
MTTFIAATNSVHASAAICDYLQDRLADDDVVHAVNSLPGGDAATDDDVRDGEEALNVMSVRLGGLASVETHQFVRENDAAEDVLASAADLEADEIVLAVRERSATDKLLFGNVAQRVLIDAPVPVVAVPRSA